jgi:hypothetical protein
MSSRTPDDFGLAIAWISLCGERGPAASCAQVMVLRAVNSRGISTPVPDQHPRFGGYLRRAPNPGRCADSGSSSGTRCTSFSASSYST